MSHANMLEGREIRFKMPNQPQWHNGTLVGVDFGNSAEEICYFMVLPYGGAVQVEWITPKNVSFTNLPEEENHSE